MSVVTRDHSDAHTVDYPKRFVWHSMLFSVKNTFLELIPPAEEGASKAGPSSRNSETRKVRARMNSALNSYIPHPAMLDIQSICKDAPSKRTQAGRGRALYWVEPNRDNIIALTSRPTEEKTNRGKKAASSTSQEKYWNSPNQPHDKEKATPSAPEDYWSNPDHGSQQEKSTPSGPKEKHRGDFNLCYRGEKVTSSTTLKGGNSRNLDQHSREKKTTSSTTTQEKCLSDVGQHQRQEKATSSATEHWANWNEAPPSCSNFSPEKYLSNATQSEDYWRNPGTSHPQINENSSSNAQDTYPENPDERHREGQVSPSAGERRRYPGIPSRHQGRMAAWTSPQEKYSRSPEQHRRQAQATSPTKPVESSLGFPNRYYRREEATSLTMHEANSSNVHQRPQEGKETSMSTPQEQADSRRAPDLNLVARLTEQRTRRVGRENVIPATEESAIGSRITQAMSAQKKADEGFFIPGDHVQLHSFETAHWLEGLTAIVKKVFNGNGGRRNRARVQIIYDDPLLGNKEGYPWMIHYANVRHI